MLGQQQQPSARRTAAHAAAAASAPQQQQQQRVLRPLRLRRAAAAPCASGSPAAPWPQPLRRCRRATLTVAAAAAAGGGGADDPARAAMMARIQAAKQYKGAAGGGPAPAAPAPASQPDQPPSSAGGGAGDDMEARRAAWEAELRQKEAAARAASGGDAAAYAAYVASLEAAAAAGGGGSGGQQQQDGSGGDGSGSGPLGRGAPAREDFYTSAAAPDTRTLWENSQRAQAPARGSATQMAAWMAGVYSGDSGRLADGLSADLRPEEFTLAKEERVRQMGADIITVDPDAIITKKGVERRGGAQEQQQGQAQQQAEQAEEGDAHRPAVATWGVFPRPKNISEAYGGGRNIKPGQALETDEQRAKREVRAAACEGARGWGADEVRFVCECGSCSLLRVCTRAPDCLKTPHATQHEQTTRTTPTPSNQKGRVRRRDGALQAGCRDHRARPAGDGARREALRGRLGPHVQGPDRAGARGHERGARRGAAQDAHRRLGDAAGRDLLRHFGGGGAGAGAVQGARWVAAAARSRRRLRGRRRAIARGPFVLRGAAFRAALRLQPLRLSHLRLVASCILPFPHATPPTTSPNHQTPDSACAATPAPRSAARRATWSSASRRWTF